MDLAAIKKACKKKLSEKRFAHVESVAKRAVQIAEQLSKPELIKKLEAAAYLHDYLKEESNSEQLSMAKYHGIKIFPEDELAANLLHGRNAASFIEEHFEIYDPDIIAAVREHTLGAPQMCLCSKILYLADQTEERRDKKIKNKIAAAEKVSTSDQSYSRALDRIRELIKDQKLNAALLAGMDLKIEEQINKQKAIHPLAIEARNSLIAEQLMI